MSNGGVYATLLVSAFILPLSLLLPSLNAAPTMTNATATATNQTSIVQCSEIECEEPQCADPLILSGECCPVCLEPGKLLSKDNTSCPRPADEGWGAFT